MSPHLLLWSFKLLPNEYVVLDIETTGLIDKDEYPGVISIGLAKVCNGEVTDGVQLLSKPHKEISAEASKVNGFTNHQIESFPSPVDIWDKVFEFCEGQLLVIHNASFDFQVLADHIKRYGLPELNISGVFCMQKNALAWALFKQIHCSQRGPSLDALTSYFGLRDFRNENQGIHSALYDAKQSASVILKLIAEANL